MPEFTIGQDRLDFDQLRELLQARLDNYDSWNDILDASTGQMVLDFMSAIGAFNQQGINRALQEVFYDTQTISSSIFRLARSQGVHIIRRTPATVRVRFTNNNNPPQTITRYSRFDIDGVEFFNREEVPAIIDENGIEIDLYQGSIRRQQQQSTGENYPTFLIGNRDFSISNYSPDGKEEGGDIYAIVRDTLEDDISQITPDSRDLYEKTTLGLWHYSSEDNFFYENTRPDGQVELQFGNGIYGNVPRNGQYIIFLWVETLGLAANSAQAGRDVTGQPSVTGVTTSAITGGMNEQLPSFYKRFGADIYSARNGPCLLYTSDAADE